jgi:hypothetical protein
MLSLDRASGWLDTASEGGAAAAWPLNKKPFPKDLTGTIAESTIFDEEPGCGD